MADDPDTDAAGDQLASEADIATAIQTALTDWNPPRDAQRVREYGRKVLWALANSPSQSHTHRQLLVVIDGIDRDRSEAREQALRDEIIRPALARARENGLVQREDPPADLIPIRPDEPVNVVFRWIGPTPGYKK